MRKLLLIAVACLVSSPIAHASKARLEALQNARFLKDPQTIFVNPAHVNSLGQYFTAEFGNQGTNPSGPKAEGGMLMNGLGGKIGMYLGHMNEMQYRLRTPLSYYQEQNPVEIFYGKDHWGASLYYSKSDKDSTNEDQTLLGARFGIQLSKLEVFGNFDFYSRSAKAAGVQYKAFPVFALGAEYQLSNFFLFADAKYGNSKQDVTTAPARNGADFDTKTFEIGAQDNKTLSVAGRTFFIGLSTKYDRFEQNSNAITTISVPVIAGIEYDVTDWAVARASVTQNFLLGYTRDQTLTSPNDAKSSIGNNTTVAAGAGFKFKGFEVDGLLAAASTGAINGNAFLTKASMTYNF